VSRGAKDARFAVERRTHDWLEEHYLRAMAGLREREVDVFTPDGRPLHMTPYHFQEIQRKLKIFRWLDRVRFESFIDIGSGFDVYPNRVRERYGVPAFYADMVHSMNLPYGGAEFGRLDHAVTMNLASLPFRDAAFDAVLCSEVLEHLVRPVEAIAELMRITRRVLIMTSLEALSVNRWERLRSHLRVDVRVPHVERNFLLLEEIEAIFGPAVHHENLLYDPDLPASAFGSAATQEAAYGGLRDMPALVAALCRAVRTRGHGPGAMGILVVRVMPGVEVGPAEGVDEPGLARWLVERTAATQHAARALLAQMADGTAPFAEVDRPVSAALCERLRCPDCRAGALEPAGAGVRCVGCGTAFRGEWGVPVLQPTRPRDEEAALDEALGRLCGSDRASRSVVRRLAWRLRRNERAPGPLKRAAWRLDRLLRRPGG